MQSIPEIKRANAPAKLEVTFTVKKYRQYDNNRAQYRTWFDVVRDRGKSDGEAARLTTLESVIEYIKAHETIDEAPPITIET